MAQRRNLALRLSLCLGVAAAALAAKPGRAAPTQAPTQAEAEKDGSITWYVAMLPTEAKGIATEFEKAYPNIKINYVVMRANQLPVRITTEQRAGQYNADIISSSAWDVSALGLRGALMAYTPPEAASLVPAAADAKNHYWVGHYVLTLPLSYNSKLLADQKLAPPASYQDLTKPEYKGKFSIEVTDYEWYHAMVQAAGQGLMDKLAANQPQFRDGHTTIVNGLIDGEFPISIGAFGYKIYSSQKKGYPLVLVNADPTVAEFQLVGIPKNAPHLHAAEFFENWLISKDAETYVEKAFQRTPTRLDVPPIKGIVDPAKTKLVYSDPNAAAQYAQYENGFNSTFHVNGH